MIDQVYWTEQAWAEVVDAIDWYNEEQMGLGDAFIEEIRSMIESMIENCNSYPEKLPGIRQARLRKFKSYALYFEEGKNFLIVYGCFHASRNPADLLTRF